MQSKDRVIKIKKDPDKRESSNIEITPDPTIRERCHRIIADGTRQRGVSFRRFSSTAALGRVGERVGRNFKTHLSAGGLLHQRREQASNEAACKKFEG